MKFENLVSKINKENSLKDIILDWYYYSTGNSVEKFEGYCEFLIEEMFSSYINNREKINKSLAGWVGENAKKMRFHNALFLSEIVKFAVEVALTISESNASMGKIVACPTAGACGIIPGVIISLNKYKKIDKEVLKNSFVVSSALGELIKREASISGAVGGCQAEIGTAAAMASLLIVYSFAPDNKRAILSAPALTLKSIMGLVCDPVGGYVEIPCVKRNAFAVSTSFTSAEMALAGIESKIPVDEVIIAMGQVGRSLNENLRETGKGGIAASKTAEKMIEDFKDVDIDH